MDLNTMTVEEMEKHLAGINANISELRSKQSALLKLQGIDDEILKHQKEISEIDKKLESAKDDHDALKLEKSSGVKTVIDKLTERIDKLLPFGKSIIKINQNNDGDIAIGWEINGMFVRREGLSGAQKVMFDQAMAHAILTGKTGILVYEAAEIDKENLKLLLEKLVDTGVQVIVNTWYNPPIKGFAKILKKWNVVKL